MQAQPDLTITKFHEDAFAQGKIGVQYTITVTNIGNAPTSGPVTVTDTLPAGLTATAISGVGWTCAQPAGPCTRADPLIGNSSGQFPDLTLTVNVADDAPAVVINNATVSGGGESNVSNDTASDSTNIAPAPDFAITKTHAGNFSPGQVGATYTITVTNVGSTAFIAGASEFTIVTETAPTGLTVTNMSGNGWDCSLVTCSIFGNLAAGASYPPITVTVNVAGDAPPLVINTATVSSNSEFNTSNNTANDLTIIQGPGPTIISVVPNSTSAGIAGVQIIVTGTNFTSTTNGVPGSVVTWAAPNSQPVPLQTSLNPNGQLIAFIPGSLLQTPEIASIYVVQAVGGGAAGFVPAVISNAVPFIVRAPSITSLSPPSATAGGPGFALTVFGADFVNNPAGQGASQIIFGGTALATTFVNSNTLTAQITAAMIQNAGPINVNVINPGGSISNTAIFNSVGLPAVLSLSPNSAVAGGPAFTLTVNGTNFTPGLSILWNGTPLVGTTFVSLIQLAATVPASLIAAAGVANVTVSGALQSLPFTIIPKLQITAAALPAGVVGTNYTFRLTGIGGTLPYVWTAAGLPAGLSLNAATGDITGIPTAAGGSTVVVTLRDAGGQTAVAQFSLTVSNVPKLTITTSALPQGTVGSPYIFRLSATGGIPPYAWSASGLPAGLFLNPATGDISGNPLAAVTSIVSVTVTDTSGQTAVAQFALVAVQPPPPPPPPPPTALVISTASPLPQGTSGAAYATPLGASGGTAPYTFSLASGSLPTGLTLSANGLIAGTPTVPGQSTFTAQVTDSAGGTATKVFQLVIVPGPLVVTGSVSDAVVGAPITVKFGAIGGVPPYVFTATGSLPPDTKFTSDGTLSGTLSTAGTFTFSITVTDSTGVTASKSFTLTVASAPLTITTASLPNGQVGSGYSAQLAATGGSPPYTWTASGLPANLSMSAAGAISGTPASDGTSTVSVTVTDSSNTKVTRTFTLVIAPAPLVISTASLANGTVGAAYQASLAATGGVPPYSWTFGGLPAGITGSSDGTLTGTPTTAGSFTVSATVTDSKGATATKSFAVTIVTPPLVITTASIPNATVGTSLSLKFAATGGTPPLTWSATGLPGGLSVAADGTLSGAPAAPGTATITVTVKDSAGVSTAKPFSLTIALPPSPGLNLTGLPPSSNPNPATQPRVGVRLPTTYPVDVTVKLTLTFTADSGPDDPMVQFQGGGRTVQIVVPAGATTGLTDVGVQIGTVAGTVTITAQLTAASQDITPVPAPAQTLRISPSAPVIVPPITAASTSTGFTVTIIGYSSTRELTQAIFTFTAATGGNLQTTQLTVPVGSLFTAWFQGSASAAFGSQFTLTQPFTVTGSTKIVSVTVTLVNSVGSSAAVSANVQ